MWAGSSLTTTWSHRVQSTAGMPRGGLGKELPRKKRRKRERAAKKAKKVAAQQSRSQRAGRREGNNKTVSFSTTFSRSGRKLKEDNRKMHEGRGRRHTGDLPRPPPVVSADTKEVNRLAKLLKLKRRKNLPAAFREDGLDYLLNLTDKTGDWEDSGEESELRGNEEGPEETETRCHRAKGLRGRERGGKVEALGRREEVEEEEEEEEEEVGPPATKKRKVKIETVKRVRFQLNDGDSQDLDLESGSESDRGKKEEEEEEERESDGYLEDSGDSEQEQEEEEEDEEEEEEEEMLARKDMKYVPPHMREDGRRRAGLEKLRRRLQGIINRLSESNIQSICMQLEQMYSENSRNDMNTCLTEVLLKASVSPALLPDRLAMLHAMVVAILHSNVGTEVGAHIIQALAHKLDSFLSQPPTYGSGKECDSVLLLMAHLYNYKVIHCILIYDIIRILVETFTERDVELLLLLLKNTGMEIRRDDATSLKDIIVQIQSKAATSSLTDSSRMRFMLETITALKTNNSRKIPNHDPTLLDHMRRLLRGLVRSHGPADENQLKISLKDLLLADQQGRWWVVGSAWTGRETQTPSSASGSQLASAESWVLELARKQRMNTDVRKNIFCVLMTSEDCVDAFEKLLKLGLKDKQEREIIHVLVDCCLQERQYNPYYAFLAQKFCELNRSHQVTFQYALWDRVKGLSSMAAFSRSNLRHLLSHLVASRALSLSVLRVVEFSELGKEEVAFYRKLLCTLLLDYTEETCKAVFSRIAQQPHLKPFRDSLLIFMRHYLTPSSSSSSSSPALHLSTQEDLMRSRLQAVEQVMRTPQHS